MTKPLKKKSKFLVVSFVITLALTITLADFCSNIITIKTFTGVSGSYTSQAFSVYAISLFNAQSKTTAIEHSVNIQKQGGAGFIYLDNKNYYVLTSAYVEKNDAELVKENLKKQNFEPEIKNLSISSITISGNFNANEQNTLSSSLSAYKTTFENLYDISIALDTNISTINESKIFIADVENMLEKTKLNFDALFNDKLTTNILYIKLSLNSLCEKISLLKNFEEDCNQNFSSKIKQTYFETLELNINLINNLNKK